MAKKEKVIDNRLGELIRIAREETESVENPGTRMTQKELSTVLGSNYNVAHSIEKGLTKVYEGELEVIAKAVHKPMSYFEPAIDLVKKEKKKKLGTRLDEGVGKRLRTLRERKGLNKKTVADEIGALPSHYLRIESGESGPTYKQLRALVDFYETSYEYILDGKGPMAPGKSRLQLEEENRRLRELVQQKEVTIQALSLQATQ